MKHILQILVFGLVFLSSETLRASDGFQKITKDNQNFNFEEMENSLSPECSGFIQSLPPHYSYDWVEVPENVEDPQSDQIKVFFYWRQARNAFGVTESAPVISFYNGGPGHSSHGSYRDIESRLHPFHVVFIDQRGTGCSDSLPAPKVSHLARYAHYLSRGIVADSETIREDLLGKKSKWSVFGQSFGSLIVHRYLALAPQSLISAHAHGYAATTNPQNWALLRMLKHKENLDDYLKKYPKDQPILSLISKVGEDFCVNQDHPQVGKIRSCGPYLIDALFIYLGFKVSWNSLHQLIQSFGVIRNGKKELNANRFKGVIGRVLYDYLGFGAEGDAINTFMNRMEAYVPREPSLSDYYLGLFEKLAEQKNDPRSWLMGEEARLHFAIQSRFRDAADRFQPLKRDLLRPEDVVQSLRQFKEIEFYLYSGNFDSFSPPEAFQSIVKMGGDRIQYTNFPSSGHAGFLTEQKVWDEIYGVYGLKDPTALDGQEVMRILAVPKKDSSEALKTLRWLAQFR